MQRMIVSLGLVAILLAPSAWARKMSRTEWVDPDSMEIWRGLSSAEKEESVKLILADGSDTKGLSDEETGADVLRPLTKVIGLGSELFPPEQKAQKRSSKEIDSLAPKVIACLDNEISNAEYKGAKVAMVVPLHICNIRYDAVRDALKQKGN